MNDYPGLNEILTGREKPLRKMPLLVLGATGDMVSKRESRDALVYLAEHGVLTPERNPVRLFAHRPIAVDRFLATFKSGDVLSKPMSEQGLAAFCELAGLTGGELPGLATEKPEDYAQLKRFGEAMVYAALPPKSYADLLDNLPPEAGVLLEKPFGTDLASARRLAAKGRGLLIDHFLAYPGMLNMLSFRCWPEMREALGQAERIEVRLLEKIQSNDRPYFRETGIVVDMIQSHCLMLLATLLMELPERLSAAALQKARLAVLQGLQLKGTPRWGQFAGFNDPAHGAPPEAEPSQAETYVEFELDWKVPLRVVCAKGVSESRFGVDVHLPGVPQALASRLGIGTGPAVLAITVNDEGRSFLGERELPFDPRIRRQPSHALLLPDALKGEEGLFVSPEEALEAWRFTESLLAALKGQPKLSYAPGADVDGVGKGDG